MSGFCYTNKNYQILFKTCFSTDVFPTTKKIANVTPVYKKNNGSEKNNYLPVSILPNLSRVFERCIYKQIAQFYDKLLSERQWGFRQCHTGIYSLQIYFISPFRF